jgi:hypothetical protein
MAAACPLLPQEQTLELSLEHHAQDNEGDNRPTQLMWIKLHALPWAHVGIDAVDADIQRAS